MLGGQDDDERIEYTSATLGLRILFSDIFADSIKSADIQIGTEGGVAGRGHEPPQFLKIYIYI
jgi:hypothetical protein